MVLGALPQGETCAEDDQENAPVEQAHLLGDLLEGALPVIP
jgi:hypothetical protein